MYTSKNFKTKKALREAVKAGEVVTVFQPNGDLFGAEPPQNGTVVIEGPWFPEPHRFYASATLKDGRVVSVR